MDFSQPHTDTSLVMIVPVQSQFSDKACMFLKPFTNAMWLLTAFISVYNGFVVWMIERDHCSDLRGSVLNQIGTLLWLAFATLFSRQGEIQIKSFLNKGKLHERSLTSPRCVNWVYVLLIVTDLSLSFFNSCQMRTIENDCRNSGRKMVACKATDQFEKGKWSIRHNLFLLTN